MASKDLELESFFHVFSAAVASSADVCGTALPEWCHLWNRMRSHGVDGRGPNGTFIDGRGLDLWKDIGKSLNITEETCRQDIVRRSGSDGCNWHKCPLYAEKHIDHLAIEMMRCAGCRAVGLMCLARITCENPNLCSARS